jgi:hypothetical protein
MSELLKFDQVKEGMILVSPWGSEVRCVGQEEEFLLYTSKNSMLFYRVLTVEFHILFGGWKVKE